MHKNQSGESTDGALDVAREQVKRSNAEILIANVIADREHDVKKESWSLDPEFVEVEPGQKQLEISKGPWYRLGSNGLLNDKQRLLLARWNGTDWEHHAVIKAHAAVTHLASEDHPTIKHEQKEHGGFLRKLLHRAA